jgi:hypothetical protein
MSASQPPARTPFRAPTGRNKPAQGHRPGYPSQSGPDYTTAVFGRGHPPPGHGITSGGGSKAVARAV